MRAKRPDGPVKVLILGQTPPPFHGQALSIARLAAASLPGIEVYHIRLAFSSTIQDVGRFRPGKVLHLVAVIFRALLLRARSGVAIVYLPPAGPNWVPVLRDVALLLVLRRVYDKVIFHFHAAGLSTFLQAQRPWVRRVLTWVYERPAGAIQISRLGPPDAEYLRARHVAAIPLGVEDEAAGFTRAELEGPIEEVVVLYVGAMVEGKGIMVLLEAVARLLRGGARISLWCMGQFASEEFERRARAYCKEQGLAEAVRFLGQRVAPEKWDYFRRADIFCFPSFYEAEAFPHVVMEAMMFGLPVVSTHWRAIPEMVREGETGYLVPVRDVAALALALETLRRDPGLRARMGRAGRRVYLEEFTLDKYLQRIAAFFHRVAEGSAEDTSSRGVASQTVTAGR